MKTQAAARFGILSAVILGLAALFGDFLSPNPPRAQNLDRFYTPPTRIHFVDPRGTFHIRPFIYRYEVADRLDSTYRERTDSPCPLVFFQRGYSYRLFGFLSCNRHLVTCSEEMLFYPLGADELGRDVLARVLAGARTSLLVVLLGLVFYACLGLTIGAAAGLVGGWLDALLMRFSEFVLALPALYLILALRALLPPQLTFLQMLALTVGTIASVTWPTMARGVRGLILQLRNSVYVEAARAIGCTPWQILRRHMLPTLAPFVLSQAVVAAPVFLLGEVVLSYLDVGFHGTAESWGYMLRSLREPRIFTNFQWNLAPLAMVFLTLFSLNQVGSRSRQANADARVARL